MTIADQQRISDLERTIDGLRGELVQAQRALEEMAGRANRHAQDAHDTHIDLLQAQDRATEAERRASDLEHAVAFDVPPQTYHSVRSVERSVGQRFTAAPDERIVGVQPGFNGKVVIWLASQRGAPEVPEADRTPEGERAVTEEVS